MGFQLQESDENSELNQEEYSSQKCCHLQYCNGIRHSNSSAVYVYPVCHVCGIELIDLLELLRNRNLTSTVSCEICSKIYSNENEGRAHFMKHFYKSTEKYENKFYCFACSPNNQEEGSVIDTNIIENSGYFTCQECNERYPTKRFFELHLKDFHSIDADDYIRLYECPDCLKLYATERSLTHHISTIHNITKGTSNNDIENQNEKWNKTYSCRKCFEMCESRGTLQVHMEEMHKHQSARFQCRLCDLEFVDKSARKEHELHIHKDMSTNKFQCTYCPLGFKNIPVLLQHMLSHKPVISFVCDICGKGFTRARYLKYHMVMHATERTFQCDLCPSKFKGLYQLKKHRVTVHAPIKKYKCNICEKRFSESGTLSKHKWTHGGYEKKFKCTLCNMKFYEAKRLRYHMRIHKHIPNTTTELES